MEAETVLVIGPTGLYARMDGASLVFDRRELSEDTDFEVAPLPNLTNREVVSLRHLKSNQFIGADATQSSGDIRKQFYGMPNVNGWYESWTAVRFPSGSIILAVEYIEQGAEFHPFASATLTLVRK